MTNVYSVYTTSQPKVRQHLNLNHSEAINRYKKFYNLLRRDGYMKTEFLSDLRFSLYCGPF